MDQGTDTSRSSRTSLPSRDCTLPEGIVEVDKHLEHLLSVLGLLQEIRVIRTIFE